MSAADVSSPEKNAGANLCTGEGMDLHTKKRVFLSIDIVESTSAKDGNTSAEWVEEFAEFLHSVNVLYQHKFSKVIGEHCRDTCEKKPCLPKISTETQDDSPEREKPAYHAVHFWKYIGDEVVLTADLFCKNHHASMHVLALAETVRELNRRFGTPGGSGKKLRVKAFAWVGGFPVRNVELSLYGQKSQKVKDFIGPSIDLGFRLSKFASEDKLVISPSLAYLILSEPGDKTHVPLCFGGMVELKGIKNRQPLIWYPVNETAENKLCNVPPADLLDFLKEHLSENSTVLPFILGPADGDYRGMYEAAVEAQKKIRGSPFYSPREKASSADAPAKSDRDAELEEAGNAICSELAKGT